MCYIPSIRLYEASSKSKNPCIPVYNYNALALYTLLSLGVWAENWYNRAAWKAWNSLILAPCTNPVHPVECQQCLAVQWACSITHHGVSGSEHTPLKITVKSSVLFSTYNVYQSQTYQLYNTAGSPTVTCQWGFGGNIQHDWTATLQSINTTANDGFFAVEVCIKARTDFLSFFEMEVWSTQKETNP